MLATTALSRSATYAQDTVFFTVDRDLIGGQSYRDVLDQRIDASKAVVVIWTSNSVGSRYVRHEAQRGDSKVICLWDPALEIGRIPGPFAANDHILKIDDTVGLLKAIKLQMPVFAVRAAELKGRES
jgi:hypothetical protein